MKTYFIFSFLFSIVITQSCNTGDRQIQQRCFNLVNQQLSWSEARNYCHNRNSYLATVPEQTTDSYLASYARTSFNINEGNFWIGLYRNSTTSKWQWDDGTPFAWNNFENPNLNYVAESIKNGKWNTFVAETRLNFVCSYYPNGAPTEPVTGSTEPPHWTTTESETVTPTEAGPCSPTDPTTFLFAYSNDLDPKIVSYVADYTAKISFGQKYSLFGNVRFDVKEKEYISFSGEFQYTQMDIHSRLPNATLGFPDSNCGSDVLETMEKFLDNPDVTLCGSKMFILLKRSPNQTDIPTRLVQKLQKFHSTFTVLASDTPSGGTNPKLMYELASLTQGFCAFDDDNTFYTSIGYIPMSGTRYLLYAQDPEVSGQGSRDLPPLVVPANCNCWFEMAIEDSGSTASVQKAMLNWFNSSSPPETFGIPGSKGTGLFTGNHLGSWEALNQTVYSVFLDFEYSDARSRRVQIRVYQNDPVDYWIPYDD